MKKRNINNKRFNNSTNQLNPFYGTGGIIIPSRDNQATDSSTLRLSLRSNPITLEYDTLDRAYTTHGIIQRFIDSPVEDAYRNWIKVKIDDLTDDELSKVEKFVQEINFPQKFKQAIIWNRLFGGATLIIDTGEESASEEFDIERLKENSILDFIPTDNWEIGQSSPNNTNNFNSDWQNQSFFYRGRTIPKSRIIKFRGKDAPSLTQKKLRGWGISEVESMLRSFNQFIKNNNVLFELLDEAKIDVFGIVGLSEALMNPNSKKMLEDRFNYVNTQKNYLRGIITDSDDTFQQKQLDLTGLAQVLTTFRESVAADLGFPVTKLFGISSAGFNSGEDEIENYNTLVESKVRNANNQQLIQCYKIITKKVLGFIPENISIEYQNLRILSSDQDQAIKDRKLQNLMQLYDRGLISNEKLVDAINVDNLLSVDLSANDLGDSTSFDDIAGY